MRSGTAFAFGALFLTGHGVAGEPKPVVTVAPSEDIVLAQGESGEARLFVVVAEGFHLQANPASEAYLIPTRLELAPSSGVKPGDPVYPPGRPYRLQGASSDLSVYEGRFEIRIPLRASPEAQPGKHSLVGKLRYQACDARRCFFPSSVPVELRTAVVPPKA